MKSRPILMSAPMVRALLAGVKTQTRRVVKAPPGEMDRPFMMDDGTWHVTDSQGGHMSPLGAGRDGACPYGAPGDLLIVRETFRLPASYDGWKPGRVPDDTPVWFNATTDRQQPEGWGKTRSSIHMPRWASRLTLEITDVRVERLQDISEADARAEGVISRSVECSDGATRILWFGVPHAGYEYGPDGGGPVQAYADLWDSINNPRGLCADDAPHGWAANPFVWALTFRVHRANVDQVLAERAAA